MVVFDPLTIRGRNQDQWMVADTSELLILPGKKAGENSDHCYSSAEKFQVMMKKLMQPLVGIVVVFTLTLSAIGADGADVVSEDLKRMADALMNDKPELIIEMTHPPILEAAGGKEAALAAVRDFLDSGADRPVIHAFQTTPPFVNLEGEEHDYVIVPTKTTVEAKGMKIRSEGYMLGIRKKEAEDWKYVDGAKLDDTMFATYFADFPDHSKLPEVKTGPLLSDKDTVAKLEEHRSRAYAAKVNSDLRQIAMALEFYHRGAGQYPTTEAGLNELTDHLPETPKDPWKRDYQYKQENETFLLWSTGPSEEDESDDMHFIPEE